MQRPKLSWINLIITVILLAFLFIGVPSYIAFLLGCALALPLNYRTDKEQNARIKAHAEDLFVNVYTVSGEDHSRKAGRMATFTRLTSRRLTLPGAECLH